MQNFVINSKKTDFETMFRLMEEENEMVQGSKIAERSKNGAHIEFKNVNFGYNQDKQILNGLNLTIGEGEKVAVVGGSGKFEKTHHSRLKN